jgi:enoyl-CoA hydratase/carnithine racemase
MERQIESQVRDGVLRLVINRPEKKNALNQVMYAALATALEGVAGNSEIKVVQLTGQGDAFTAGNDMADFASPDESQGNAAKANGLPQCR